MQKAIPPNARSCRQLPGSQPTDREPQRGCRQRINNRATNRPSNRPAADAAIGPAAGAGVAAGLIPATSDSATAEAGLPKRELPRRQLPKWQQVAEWFRPSRRRPRKAGSRHPTKATERPSPLQPSPIRGPDRPAAASPTGAPHALAAATRPASPGDPAGQGRSGFPAANS